MRAENFLTAVFFIFTFALCCTAGVKIDEKAMFPLTEDSKQKDGVKYGEWVEAKFSGSKIFPGTERKVWVYVPAEYDGKTKACVVVLQDGPQFHIGNVISNLLAKGEIPMMIAVASSPGVVEGEKDEDSPRANRTLEYDTPSPRFADFIVSELLPFAETLKTKDGRKIILSRSGNDRMITGFSSGAAAAFNAAWARPWEFSRVFTGAGSFTGLRGSFANATLVHKYEPKPIRFFLQSGSRDMWTCFGDWWSANQSMVRALEFAGYDFKYVFGDIYGIQNNAGGQQTVIKTIYDKSSKTFLGIQAMGRGVNGLIATFAIIIKLKITIEQIPDFVYINPVFNEFFKEVSEKLL